MTTTTTTTSQRVIAVGYDGSAPGTAALEWAALEARRTAGSLRIISVVHYPGMPASSLESSPILPGSLLNRAHKLAAEGALLARKVLAPDLVETQIVIGAAAEALVTASRSAQLLVVGNRGRSERASMVLGSVSFAVTAHAHCPVVVVRKDGFVVGPEHAVVVGVDGSSAGDRALEVAAGIAAHAGAPLRVVCAWDLPAADSWAHSYWETASPDGDWARTQHDVATKVALVAADRAQSQHSDLVVTTEVLQGPAGTALTALSGDAGLVVVGSRGLGGFTGLVLGSVSHHVINDSACPVVVVRQ